MKRIVVGPFNRVEGDLEVKLDIDDGVVVAAQVAAPLYRGFEQILLGRPAFDGLTLAPRICGICSVSHSMAAAAALRAASSIEPAENGVLAANIAHAAENAADHLTHFYIFFMPDFARETYRGRKWHGTVAERFAAMRGRCVAEVLPARARLLEIMGVLAGKWPHSVAFQPGGTTRAIDLGERMRLMAIIAEFRAFLENTVFADSLEAVLALDCADALDDWREGRDGDFARFLALADDLALEGLGRGRGPFMSFGAYHGVDGSSLFPSGVLDVASMSLSPLAVETIAEDVSHTWMQAGPPEPLRGETRPDPDKPDGYSWCKAPRLAGRTVEVGALARQAIDGQPLVRDLLAGSGPNVKTRVVARLIETARLAQAMDAWVRAVRLREPFCHRARSADGAGAGLVEAARGSLGHWIEISGDRIRHYQIIAPTTWNFSPRDAAGVPGPLEQALVGTPVGAAVAAAVAVQHVVRSFDPCMVCTAH